MTQLEIRKRIDDNNRIIENILKPNQFTLNNIISNALAENRKLQKICIHNFVDGYCEYCDMEENND